MDPANIRLIRLICQNHLTAGGTRNSIQVERFLQQHDDREIAQTLYKHDPLYVPGNVTPVPWPHLETAPNLVATCSSKPTEPSVAPDPGTTRT